ncbi:MAG TPA: hypothetical protein VK939_02060 [Longimicrobiales bacterium]|nr:hypothetical protein [Longimicrobiales bacterium]
MRDGAQGRPEITAYALGQRLLLPIIVTITIMIIALVVYFAGRTLARAWPL